MIDGVIVAYPNEYGRRLPKGVILKRAAVHVSLDHVTVGALESRVDIEEGLHVVVAGWQVAERVERITADRITAFVDHGNVARFVITHVDTPERITGHTCPKVRHFFVIACNDEKRPPDDGHFEPKVGNTCGSGFPERDAYLANRLFCTPSATYTDGYCKQTGRQNFQ